MSYRTSLRIPVLRWIRWKEKRPAQMLGLTREQLRRTKADGWDAERYRFWAENAGAMRFEDAEELLQKEEPRAIREMIGDGVDPLRTVRYLRKQQKSYSYLKDYRRMARQAELDLAQEVVAWPPHLQAAHDRLQQEVRYQVSGDCRKQFAEMSARCAGLCWEHDGICIRPAATPEELVQEGATLHHCVGGYARNHAAGSIILFVRHARRPERSWYTLNVNVREMFDFGSLAGMAMRLNVEIGGASYWSELNEVSTADALISKGIITDPLDYLERVPDGYIKDKAGLIESIEAQRRQAEQLQQAQAMMQMGVGGGMGAGGMPAGAPVPDAPGGAGLPGAMG